MNSISGTRLGCYDVAALIGEGGMGQVYQATDTNLKRQVAIKVLPGSVAADPERLARFQREAEVLASLNHPSIAAIYGLERGSGVTALVMELVEGPTLADRIAKGPIPLDEALPIATQMAEALEAAHDQGIVHRDLKPANVKVRPDGTVKVLDFGLAKAMDPTVSSASGPHSLAITSPAMTMAGTILGTAAYMSPEQARGRTVDARADIWAFGAVLFEMLTGTRAFAGEDITDTLAAVVLREPDWDALPRDTPAGVRRLLTRCLRKDPKHRLRHIADARLELHEPPGDSSPAAVAAPALRRSRSRLPFYGSLAALVVITVIAMLQTVRLSSARADAPEVVRFSIAPAAGLEFGDVDSPLSAVSPDGTRVVLAFTRGNVPQLYMRRFDELEAKPIAGTEGGSRPFFSPDGKWIAFGSQNVMKKVASEGGAAVKIADAVFGTGAWAPDDTIVFTPTYTSGLWRVPASGGTPQKLTEPNTADGELGHFWPQILPDGKTVLFTSFRTPADTSRVELYSLDTGKRKVILDGGFYGRYVPTGHLLFARSTTVMAASFNPERPETVGSAVPVLTGVAATLPDGLAQFSVSDAGTLSYVSQAALTAPRQLAWLDRAGRSTFIGDAHRRFEDPALSPDGQRLALTIRDDVDADVWVYDLARGTFGRVTTSPTTQFSPVWMPDSRRLFFVFEEPIFHIYSRAVDGGEPARVVDGPFDVSPQSVSPNAQFLVYRRSGAEMRAGLWLLPLAPGGKPRALVDTTFDETGGAVSPDGHWLSYTSNETGRDEIYVQPFPDGGDRLQVSTNGGRAAKWSHDGKELFYREEDKMMAAAVSGRTVGRPVMLFEKRFDGYDVARDGRFVAVLPDASAQPAPTHIVLHWFEELRRAVPPK